MSTTKEGSSREAGDKLPVPGACGTCVVSTAAAVSQVFQIRESGRVPQVDSEAKASAMRRAKALPDCILQFALHGSGGSFALAAGNRQSAATCGTSNDESGDGLKCLSKLCRGRGGPLRRSARLLPWLEDASRASRERLGRLWRDVVAASLPSESSAWGDFQGKWLTPRLLSKVGRLFG